MSTSAEALEGHLFTLRAPPVAPDPLPQGAKPLLWAGMLSAHVLAGWALLQVPAVQQAVSEVAPMMVDLVSLRPQAPPAPPPKPQPRKPPPPAPVLAAAPRLPQPAPVFEAPPPPPEPPALQAPTAPPAEPAPPSPPAAPAPAAPRQVSLTQADWLREPSPVYPQASKRLGEEGVVILRVLFDAKGVPRQWLLHKGSGLARLDQAALAAAPAARVRPRKEDGVPMDFWSLVRLDFELEH